MFDATSIAGSLIAHLGSFCDGHLSFRMSAIFKVQCKRRVDSVAASPREYLVRRPAKNVISPPRKLIACGKVQRKRRVDSVAASPREYLVRRPAKNVISPPKTPPPKKKKQETTMQKSRVSCKLKKEVDSVWQGTVQEKSG